MLIRILKRCELGKPGRSIFNPTNRQLAFAKRNPSIARLVYPQEDGGASRLGSPEPSYIPPTEVKPVEIKMVEPQLTPESEAALQELYEKKHGQAKKPTKKKQTPKKTTKRSYKKREVNK